MIRPDERRASVPCDEPVEYDDFRLGLTFEDVAHALWAESRRRYETAHPEPLWISRSTVLGRMHELKTEAYARYLEECEEIKEGRARARKPQGGGGFFSTSWPPRPEDYQ